MNEEGFSFQRGLLTTWLSGLTAACPTELVDCSDLTRDGVIDVTDFSTFSVLFGTASTNWPPNCLLPEVVRDNHARLSPLKGAGVFI